MIDRFLSNHLLNLMDHFPAMAILGPRQVGKTTLAKSIIPKISRDSFYLDLELHTDVARLDNAELFFLMNEDKCIIIDEIQRMPELFPLLRAVIDRNRANGRFILLGSSSPKLLHKSEETLSGRIVYNELTPLVFGEIKDICELSKHWIRGGFPQAVLEENDFIRLTWFKNYIKTYLESELPLLGLNTSSQILERFLMMLAFNQGSVWNASTYAKSLGISVPTVNKYLDFLESAFLVRKLHPYFTNAKKRITRSPKVYIRDSGMLHYLLGINGLNALLGNPVAGYSWEAYVIEQIISTLGDACQYYYYRTYDGTEVDLVLCQSGKPIQSVEVKMNAAPGTSKSLTIAIQDLGTNQNFIIIPNNTEKYFLKENLVVLALGDFLENSGIKPIYQ